MYLIVIEAGSLDRSLQLLLCERGCDSGRHGDSVAECQALRPPCAALLSGISGCRQKGIIHLYAVFESVCVSPVDAFALGLTPVEV